MFTTVEQLQNSRVHTAQCIVCTFLIWKIMYIWNVLYVVCCRMARQKTLYVTVDFPLETVKVLNSRVNCLDYLCLTRINYLQPYGSRSNTDIMSIKHLQSFFFFYVSTLVINNSSRININTIMKRSIVY